MRKRDVAAELRRPQRLAPGDKYDVLVVTERHDLPAVARKERTAFYLTDMAHHALAGNPDAEILLYHTWLNVDLEKPLPWIDHERAVAPMWECVASRANLKLPARGDVPRVRMLPGGSALAEMAAALWEGNVPGVAAETPAARVRLLFSDNVHLNDVGRYYIALLHYAVLFGRSPEGAVCSPIALFRDGAIYANAGVALCSLVWPARQCRRAAGHGRVPEAHTGRHLSGLCHVSTRRERVASRTTQAPVRRLFCRREYADGQDPENPFSSSK